MYSATSTVSGEQSRNKRWSSGRCPVGWLVHGAVDCGGHQLLTSQNAQIISNDFTLELGLSTRRE